MEQQTESVFDPETICRNCGRCCVRKEIVRGKVVFRKNEHCPNLVKDEQGRSSCKVYEDRFTKILDIGGQTIRCIPTEVAYKQGLLPADCPYVYFYKNGMDGKLRSFLLFQEICETQNWENVVPRPKKNCKHCYGRGYVGKNINTQAYVKCGCIG